MDVQLHMKIIIAMYTLKQHLYGYELKDHYNAGISGPIVIKQDL